MTSRRRTPTPARLATQYAELSLAAPQVIAHRVARMALAGGRPSRRDSAEFRRMGAEKVTAFTQSWMAMWMTLWLAPLRMLPMVFAAGLAPVHRTAVANARRLARGR